MAYERRDISYPVAAMRRDAERWINAAAVLGQAWREAQRLCLTRDHFSTIAERATQDKGDTDTNDDSETGITAIYEAARHKIADLLWEGQDVLRDIGFRLMIVANRTDGTEEEIRELLRRFEKSMEELLGW
jgi:FMN phosphatase YigB (HAD superfamily)